MVAAVADVSGRIRAARSAYAAAHRRRSGSPVELAALRAELTVAKLVRAVDVAVNDGLTASGAREVIDHLRVVVD